MGYLAVKKLSSLLKSDTKQEFVEYMESKHCLHASLFKEFQNYMERARSEAAAKNLKQDIGNKSLVDLFMHEDQVQERLEFIKFYFNQGKVNLNSGHLKILWTQLVTRSLDDNDRKAMYSWLREVCDQIMNKESSSMISIEEIIKFYNETMVLSENESEDEYKSLSIQGFQCI